MAKKKFIVTHPKLYMKVEGKLAHVETDTEIQLEEKEAKSLLIQGKILAVGTKKTVKVGDNQKADSEADSEAK
jgi:hypothetical protein